MEVIRFLGSRWGEAATNCIVTLGKESLGKNVGLVDESPVAPADGEGEGDDCDGRLRVGLGQGGVQEKDLLWKPSHL